MSIAETERDAFFYDNLTVPGGPWGNLTKIQYRIAVPLKVLLVGFNFWFRRHRFRRALMAIEVGEGFGESIGATSASDDSKS